MRDLAALSAARLSAAAAARPAATTRTHATEARARTAAARVGCPNTEVGARQTPAGWIGIVWLRPDQLWMSAQVRERGCLPEVLS